MTLSTDPHSMPQYVISLARKSIKLYLIFRRVRPVAGRAIAAGTDAGPRVKAF
jgi:hypothetical protein